MLELAEGQVLAVKRIRPSDLARLAERAGERVRDPVRARKRVAASAPVLVQLSQVDLYVDYRLVLRDLDWQLRSGEHWAVYGANGAGKIQFFKVAVR